MNITSMTREKYSPEVLKRLISRRAAITSSVTGNTTAMIPENPVSNGDFASCTLNVG